MSMISISPSVSSEFPSPSFLPSLPPSREDQSSSGGLLSPAVLLFPLPSEPRPSAEVEGERATRRSRASLSASTSIPSTFPPPPAPPPPLLLLLLLPAVVSGGSPSRFRGPREQVPPSKTTSPGSFERRASLTPSNEGEEGDVIGTMASVVSSSFPPPPSASACSSASAAATAASPAVVGERTVLLVSLSVPLPPALPPVLRSTVYVASANMSLLKIFVFVLTTLRTTLGSSGSAISSRDSTTTRASTRPTASLSPVTGETAVAMPCHPPAEVPQKESQRGETAASGASSRSRTTTCWKERERESFFFEEVEVVGRES